MDLLAAALARPLSNEGGNGCARFFPDVEQQATSENVFKARRIGHATFETPDMERMIDYYTEVIGLVLAEREKDRAFLASKVGPLTVAINKGAAERCAALSFEVAPDSDFGALDKARVIVVHAESHDR